MTQVSDCGYRLRERPAKIENFERQDSLER